MKKIGLLVPKTNLTVEYELQKLFNSNYFNCDKEIFYIFKLDYKTNYKENKLKYLEEIGNDSINKIKDMEYIGVDKIYFFCTTSSIIKSGLVINNNPMKSLINIARNKKIDKCLLITPYNNDLGLKVKQELIKENINVVKTFNLNLLHTYEYFEYGKNKLKNFIINNYKPEYENIIISCTNLPTISIIEELEKELNINIISSNSSLFEQIKSDVKEYELNE